MFIIYHLTFLMNMSNFYDRILKLRQTEFSKLNFLNLKMAKYKCPQKVTSKLIFETI